MGGESTHLPDLKPKPTLRIHFNEIGHEGTTAFLSLVDSSHILENAIKNILRHLYQPCKVSKVPPIRSVTLILRSMDGVAYETGTMLDEEHKEIHFSLNHIKNVLAQGSVRCRDEMIGVVTHEMVHAWQYNAMGTAPGGLIEGIADFVRLRSGLAPPHWQRPTGQRRSTSKADDTPPKPESTHVPQPSPADQDKPPREPKWDDGYEKTAFFLDWLDQTYENGIVARMNETMRTTKYDDKTFWTGLFGKDHTIDVLWKKYMESVFKSISESAGKDTNPSS